MRVNTIQSARKSQTCGGCRKKIKRGDPYRWAKSRYGPKMIRCMSPACAFRPTDLSSAKTARIEEAIDDARDMIASAQSYEDIQSALQEVADIAQEVADEYQEANDAWADGRGRDDLQEKADACRSFADECSNWSFGGEDDEETVRERVLEEEDQTPEQGESIDDFEKRMEELQDAAWETVLQEMREEADGVLDGFSI